jgi:hypothetical protein
LAFAPSRQFRLAGGTERNLEEVVTEMTMELDPNQNTKFTGNALRHNFICEDCDYQILSPIRSKANVCYICSWIRQAPYEIPEQLKAQLRAVVKRGAVA